MTILILALGLSGADAKSKKEAIMKEIIGKQNINGVLNGSTFGVNNHIHKHDVLRRGSIYLIGANTYEFDDAGAKVLNEKDEFQYIDRRNIVFTNYIYDEVLGDLILDDEVNDKYNDYDQILLSITKSNDENGNLVNSRRIEYTYDDSRNLSKVEYNEWDEEKQDWAIWSIDNYEYQNNRLIKKNSQYIYGGDLFDASYEVTEYSYDASGNVIEEILYSSEEDGTLIEYSSKIAYEYNQKNKLIKLEVYSYEIVDEEEETGEWFKFGESLYQYDNYDNLVENITEFGFGFFSFKTKSVYNYNNSYSYSDLFLPFYQDEVGRIFNHMLVDINQYEFDSETNEWIEDEYTELLYSQGTGSVEIVDNNLIEISPNPAKDIIGINFNKSEEVIKELLVFDLLGNQVLRFIPSSNSNFEINISEL